MSAELRRDVRYESSQRAVLLNDGDPGNLCVITNLSCGGLCLAVIGSSKPIKRDRVDLKLNRGTVLCNVVNRTKERLHCRFEDQAEENDLLKLLPPVVTKSILETAAIEKQRERPIHPGLEIYDRNGTWGSPRSLYEYGQRADPSVIYADRVPQADPNVDALVEALNPYQAPKDRAIWATWFKTAIRQMSNRYSSI
jgi:hypothetical protein